MINLDEPFFAIGINSYKIITINKYGSILKKIKRRTVFESKQIFMFVRQFLAHA